MPKRNAFNKGGNRVWNSNNVPRNNYNEHDDRDRKPNGDLIIRKDANRRVSFKTSGHGRNNNVKSRAVELGVRARLEDDDDMMENASRLRRRGSPIPRSVRPGGKGGKMLVEAGSGWFQVVIPYGQKYDKEFLLKALLQATSPEIFLPHYWKVESTCVSFYVDEITMARALLNVDRCIELPDGFKLLIKVRNGMPPVQLDGTLRQMMKLAMETRYSPMTKALDLTKFHSDENLRTIYCGLSRPTIMLEAINIIAENTPDLEALNLDNNKIFSMEQLKHLLSKLPNLKILHLANNKITNLRSLIHLKHGNIVDLVLTGNPAQKNTRDHDAYVRTVRDILPKLLRLDGVTLPPKIGFDIEEEVVQILPAKASFLSDPAGAEIVRQFLQQYYAIYDSDNRQPLLEAYHQQSSLSLTCSFNPNIQHKLTKYLPHNRNIQRYKDINQRCKLLKSGNLEIVQFLKELPRTEHDLQSFGVDLTLFTPSLILLTVTGIFREKLPDPSAGTSYRQSQNTELPLRSFQRSLVIVPHGSGFCIKNDMIHINTVTIAQVKTAFKPAPVAQAPVQPAPVQGALVAMEAPASIPDHAAQLQMIQQMSSVSQMNLEWSKKCLEETNWDFLRAGYVFTELNKQNKIPPEAFIK